MIAFTCACCLSADPLVDADEDDEEDYEEDEVRLPRSGLCQAPYSRLAASGSKATVFCTMRSSAFSGTTQVVECGVSAFQPSLILDSLLLGEDQPLNRSPMVVTLSKRQSE